MVNHHFSFCHIFNREMLEDRQKLSVGDHKYLNTAKAYVKGKIEMREQ